jgi:probable rRNA maturation factor
MIYINNTFEWSTPVTKKQVEAIAKNILTDYKIELYQLGVTYLTDEALLEINKEFLKHDYYTDIITFYYSENDEPLEGELFISLERVLDNAKVNHATFEEELSRVIAHGCLHLCGLKDETEDEKKIMREKENYYLDKLFHMKQNKP